MPVKKPAPTPTNWGQAAEALKLIKKARKPKLNLAEKFDSLEAMLKDKKK